MSEGTESEPIFDKASAARYFDTSDADDLSTEARLGTARLPMLANELTAASPT